MGKLSHLHEYRTHSNPNWKTTHYACRVCGFAVPKHLAPKDRVLPFEVNDVVKYTTKSKSNEETHEVIIRWVEDRGNCWYFGWIPYRDFVKMAAWRCASVYKHGPKAFGIQSFEIIGHVKPELERKPPNLVGDPAYDLMHDPRRK